MHTDKRTWSMGFWGVSAGKKQDYLEIAIGPMVVGIPYSTVDKFIAWYTAGGGHGAV